MASSRSNCRATSSSSETRTKPGGVPKVTRPRSRSAARMTASSVIYAAGLCKEGEHRPQPKPAANAHGREPRRPPMFRRTGAHTAFVPQPAPKPPQRGGGRGPAPPQKSPPPPRRRNPTRGGQQLRPGPRVELAALLAVLAGAALLPAAAASAGPPTPTPLTFYFMACTGPAGTPKAFYAVKQPGGAAALRLLIPGSGGLRRDRGDRLGSRRSALHDARVRAQ